MLTNSLYCAICSAPFERPTICDHEDSFYKNPPDDDVSFNICFGMGYDSRKLSYQETEVATILSLQRYLVADLRC